MSSLGTKLRSERQRQGLSLEEISTRTRIRQSYLEAIEDDKLETIPGGFFSRSFARQYATTLGVDKSEIHALLEAVAPPPEDAVQMERLLADYRPSPGLRTPESEEEERDYQNEAGYLKESRSGGVWMALAGLLICGSITYLAWQQRPELFQNVFAKSQVSDQITPAPAPAPSPSVPQQTQVEPPVPAETQAATSPAMTPPPEVPPETNATAAVTVTVRARELTWLRLFSDKKKIFGGTMEAGEIRTLTGTQTAMVFTGNAGGLELSHNGNPIGTTGPRGMVRTVVFTPENYEIRTSMPEPRKNQRQTDTESVASAAVARGR